MPNDARPPETRIGYDPDLQLKPPDWHGLVTLDLLFNNLATGLFLVAAIGELAAPDAVGPAARWPYPLALAFLAADLLCLVLDLGSPTRFHHMLRVFKPTSPMSLGTWFLTAYSLPLTLIAAIDLLPAAGLLPAGSATLWWARRLAVVAGLPLALGSAGYKGVLFSTSSQPGWRDARWLGAYLVNSAFVLGLAGMLALSGVLGLGRASATLRPAFAPMLVANLVALGLLAADLRGAIVRRHTRKRLATLGALAVGLGLLVPLGLSPRAGDTWPMMLALAALLAGGLVLRHAIVTLPHVGVACRDGAAR